jgi:hypothetical protein
VPCARCYPDGPPEGAPKRPVPKPAAALPQAFRHLRAGRFVANASTSVSPPWHLHRGTAWRGLALEDRLAFAVGSGL